MTTLVLSETGAHCQQDSLSLQAKAFLPANCKFPKRNWAFPGLAGFLPRSPSEFPRFAPEVAMHCPEDQGESGATVGGFLEVAGQMSAGQGWWPSAANQGRL